MKAKEPFAVQNKQLLWRVSLVEMENGKPCTIAIFAWGRDLVPYLPLCNCWGQFCGEQFGVTIVCLKAERLEADLCERAVPKGQPSFPIWIRQVPVIILSKALVSKFHDPQREKGRNCIYKTDFWRFAA